MVYPEIMLRYEAYLELKVSTLSLKVELQQKVDLKIPG
jgi:hypothetical protein